MSTQREDLAREIFIADNSGQSREASLKDWAEYGEHVDDAYTYPIADGLIDDFDELASRASYGASEDVMETWLEAATRTRATIEGATP